VVAAGVAEALFTTAAGLLVAVPAVMLYNHFVRRMGVMLTVAENHARSLRLAADEAGLKGRGDAGEPPARTARSEPKAARALDPSVGPSTQAA
jgi:hypothetical protein